MKVKEGKPEAPGGAGTHGPGCPGCPGAGLPSSLPVPAADPRPSSCRDSAPVLRWREAAWETWEPGRTEAEPTSPFSPPLSAAGRLGFPVTSEWPRSVGAHVPGQVGQVARVFGQGRGAVSLGPALFGLGCFTCRLSVPPTHEDGCPGFSFPREGAPNACRWKPCHSSA